jgi:GT2 family glycosyltransferase
MWKRDPVALLAGFVPGLRRRYLGSWPHDAPRIVPWVLGAALVIRREAFEEVGGFDESFFMYSEEVDFCYRVRSRGWETHFAPVTDVTHEGSASTRQQRTAMLREYCAGLTRFYRRHYSGRRLAQAEFTMACLMGLRVVRDSARRALLRDERRRTELAENVGVWRQVLADARRRPQ